MPPGPPATARLSSVAGDTLRLSFSPPQSDGKNNDLMLSAFVVLMGDVAQLLSRS